MKLNIGCGRDYRQGWVNIDISRDVKAEEYLDIRKDGLPFADCSVEEIYISGVLEQIGSNDELIFAMNEMHRVLYGKGDTTMYKDDAVGGKAVIIVPNARYAIAHRDPMDIRKFTPETFPYFDVAAQEYRLYGSVYGFLPWTDIQIQENQRHIMTITMTKCVLPK